jgi:hypothetical protein
MLTIDAAWKHAALTSPGQILNPPKIYRPCQLNPFNIENDIFNMFNDKNTFLTFTCI